MLFIVLYEDDVYHERDGTFSSMKEEGNEFISRVRRFRTDSGEIFLTHGSLNSRIPKLGTRERATGRACA